MEKSSNDKSQKKGISTGAKVAIGGGIAFLVIVGLVFLSMFLITFLAPIYLANNLGKEIIEKIDDDWEAADLEDDNDVTTTMFNFEMEGKNGIQTGKTTIELLDEVSLLINKYKSHPIIVIYNNNVATKQDEIRLIKNSINEDKTYDIEFDYDQKGYINKVTIYDK